MPIDRRDAPLFLTNMGESTGMAASTAPSSSALVAGGTGATGRQVMAALLSSSSYSSAYHTGRRPFSFPMTGVTTPSAEQQAKLHSIIAGDDEFSDAAKLAEALPASKGWDAIFITLSTTYAKSANIEQYESISRDYVLNLAKAARDSAKAQRLVYCSVGSSC